MVEEPSTEFTVLRDVIDCQNLLSSGFFQNIQLKLDEQTIKAVKSKLKLAKSQIRHCYEILMLKLIDINKEVQYKQYRLAVKRRLFCKYSDLIADSEESESRRKEELDKIYREIEGEYKIVLSKLKKI